MKKTKVVLLMVLFSLLLAAGAASDATPEDAAPAPEPAFIDLDLSGLSGTVVYAQVYNMMYDPDAYLGKVIRMAGYYNYYEDTERGVVYHACIVPDATACCAQGIEFVRAGSYRWPDDYPDIGTDILVTGRLELYEEDGTNYLHLVNAEVLWEGNGE